LPVDLVRALLRLHGNAGRAPAPATIAVVAGRLEFTFH